jgi:hypothetical protein
LVLFVIYIKDVVVGGEGFEPPKAVPTDLQSAPFDRSGTPPITHNYFNHFKERADGGIRTPDRLITNQMLWPTELHRQFFFPAWHLFLRLGKKKADLLKRSANVRKI